MVLKLKGKKAGMTQRFRDNGHVVACTVIEVEPNIITQVKTKDTDGYNAIQMGTDKVVTKDPRTIERRVHKPMRGHFAKAEVEPRRRLHESRLDQVDEFEVGQEITVDTFQEGDYVDITGTAKGKGFQGVQKKFGYKGGPASHGSGFHRRPGSIGMRSTPGRVFPGKPMPGQMGGQTTTIQSLEVLAVDTDNNLIIVKGAIPGPTGSFVTIAQANKRQKRS